MIWFLAATLITRGAKFVAVLVTSLVCVILMGAPMLGILTQPWTPWYLSATHSTTTVASPGSGVGGIVFPTAVPTVGVTNPRDTVARVIGAAMGWLGTPYLWGGCSHSGIDCSCFVQTVWATVGVHLPRTTVPQMAALPPVPVAQLQAGDLVFFRQTCTGCGADPTHVGMVVNAQAGVMIDAGDPVQLNSYTTGFYASHFMGAGRPHE